MIFDFTNDETDYIAKTLSQRPFFEVANLIGKMQLQVQRQQQEQQNATNATPSDGRSEPSELRAVGGGG